MRVETERLWVRGELSTLIATRFTLSDTEERG